MFVMMAFSDNVDHNNANIINNNTITTKYVKRLCTILCVNINHY